jgi:hypothetical protein
MRATKAQRIEGMKPVGAGIGEAVPQSYIDVVFYIGRGRRAFVGNSSEDDCRKSLLLPGTCSSMSTVNNKIRPAFGRGALAREEVAAALGIFSAETIGGAQPSEVRSHLCAIVGRART